MREVALIRRITAGVGDWPGDGSLWSTASPPAAAGAPHVEVGKGPDIDLGAVAVSSHGHSKPRGIAGMIRVIDENGDPIAKQFTLTFMVEWLRVEDPDNPTAKISDWRELTGTAPKTVGDGTDFTTDPILLEDARVAFHLVPIGGSLPENSKVEIWANSI